ncbi:MAG: glutamate ligase domain-containing protein, partial [Flavobacteriales bacterium]
NKWLSNFKIGHVTIEGVEFKMPGNHNLQNALVASAVCLHLGVDKVKIKNALESFNGIKRRFEFHIEHPDLVYIDDYAHHPTELNATISAVKLRYSSKKITGIFQPHLFSRTRDFMDEFAESLAALDQIYLLDIYPAREEPIDGVDSQSLLDKIPNPSKKLVDKVGLLKMLEADSLDVLLTLGAGDIDQLVLPISEKLKKALV